MNIFAPLPNPLPGAAHSAGPTQNRSPGARRSSTRPPWAAKSRFGKNRKRQQNVFFQGCPLGPKKAPKRPPREGRKVVNVSNHTMKVMIPLCRSWPPGSLRTHPCPTRGGLRGPLGSQKTLPHFSAFQQFSSLTSRLGPGLLTALFGLPEMTKSTLLLQ